MIFFHLKNCLFQSFSLPRPTASHIAGYAVHFPAAGCDVARNSGSFASLFESVAGVLHRFHPQFLCVHPAAPTAVHRISPPAFCIKQRINHTSFLFVQCPEALRFSSAQAVKRLPLGTRGALGAYDFIRTPRFRPGRWRRSFRPHRRRRSRDPPSRS